MILYDSQGGLVDDRIHRKVTKSLLSELTDLCSFSHDIYMIPDEEHNLVELFIPRTVSDIRLGMINRACGVTLYINQTDGKPVGFTHYYCMSDDLKKQTHRSLLINSTNWFIPSVNEGLQFPEIKELINRLYDKYDLRNRNLYSYFRNLLIGGRENPYIQSKGYVWNQFLTIRKQCDKAHYTDSTIFFLTEGKSDKVRALGEVLEYNGNLYSNASDFLSAYKQGIEYSVFRYGDDEVFREYCASRDYDILACAKNGQYKVKDETDGKEH